MLCFSLYKFYYIFYFTCVNVCIVSIKNFEFEFVITYIQANETKALTMTNITITDVIFADVWCHRTTVKQ